tara:strand:- start:176 stop:1321 length:1146 start_codon:yes stop_codon:yes gene_type:complete
MSRTIFVNTQLNFPNQVNDFRVDLNADPIECDDDEEIRVNVSQFYMPKNFNNVNPNQNGAFRLIMDSMNDFDDFDGEVFLPQHEYYTVQQYIDAFATRVAQKIGQQRSGGSVTITYTISNPDRGFVCGDINNDGQRLPQTDTGNNADSFDLDVTFTPPAGTTFAGGTLLLQCLNIPVVDQDPTGAVRTDFQLNDSYVVLGAKPVRTYEAAPGTTNSFNMTKSSGSLRIRSFYNCNQTVNTIPYAYIRLNQIQSMACATTDRFTSEQGQNTMRSTIIAKAPEVVDNMQQIFYRFEDNRNYHALIGAKFITGLDFRITDHYNKPFEWRATVGPLTLYAQQMDGNAFLNMTVNIDIVKRRIPKALREKAEEKEEPKVKMYNLFS